MRILRIGFDAIWLFFATLLVPAFFAGWWRRRFPTRHTYPTDEEMQVWADYQLGPTKEDIVRERQRRLDLHQAEDRGYRDSGDAIGTLVMIGAIGLILAGAWHVVRWLGWA